MNLPTKEEWEAAARCMYVHGERVHIVEAVRAIARGDLVVCSNVVRVTQWKHTWHTGESTWTTKQYWNGYTSNESQPLYAPATSIPEPKP